MATQVHPRVQLRGIESGILPTRVLVHAPSPARSAWIDAELAHRAIVVQLGFSIAHVVAALVEDPPPRPQILVADFDELEAGAVMDLHALRARGWFGRIIALGHVSPSLRTSLSIEHVIGAPFERDALRQIITASRDQLATTVRLPVL